MERISADVRRELGRFGAVGSIGRVVEVWTDAVGESIARNAWPARVGRDGTLHVNASSSAWAFELTQLAPAILGRLRETMTEAALRGLRFAPGPLPEPAATGPDAAHSERLAPSPETLAEAGQVAAAIADEDLRKIVERAAAASLARAADRRAV